MATCQQGLDHIEEAMTNYELALREAKEEKAQSGNSKDKNSQIAEILLERGKLYVKRRQPKMANLNFDEAVNLFKEPRGDTSVLADVGLY